MARRLLLLAILLCGPASRGLAGQAEKTAPDAGTRERRAPPLSAEDEELVKQLALLEDVDLVRNLDLFEERSADAAKALIGFLTSAEAAPHFKAKGFVPGG